RMFSVNIFYDVSRLFECDLPFARGKDETDEIGACINGILGIFQCLHAANFHFCHFFTFSFLIISAGWSVFINVSPTSRHWAFPSAMRVASAAVCIPLSAMKRMLSS